MHFQRERLHTDRYIQRLDVTAHTRTHNYIYKCMYISEMPHSGARLGEECSGTLCAYIWIYIYIHLYVCLCVHFHHLEDAFKGADGLGRIWSWSRQATARVVCVPLSHLKHASQSNSVFNQFSHKNVCVYPKA